MITPHGANPNNGCDDFAGAEKQSGNDSTVRSNLVGAWERAPPLAAGTGGTGVSPVDWWTVGWYRLPSDYLPVIRARYGRNALSLREPLKC